MINVIYGPAGCGKTKRSYRLLLDTADRYKDRNHILVIPEQSSISAQKDIVEMSPNKGIINIDILSFNRLAHRIFESCGGEAYELIDDSGKNLIIRRIAEKNADSLEVVGGDLKKRGYISEVRSVISEFMQYGIKPEDIDGIAGASYSRSRYLSQKLMDIKLLYREFIDYMGQSFMTREEILIRAASMVKEASFLKESTLIFDSFTGFTPVQYTFMEALSCVCKDIYVTVTLPGDRRRSLSLLGTKTIEHLENIAEKHGGLNRIELKEDLRHNRDSGLYILGSRIFDTTPEGFGTVDKTVEFYSANDPYGEVKDTVRRISNLVRNEGYRYKECGIIMGDPSLYSDIIRDTASRYRLPVYVDSTRRIELNPFTEFIRAVIAVIRDNYSYDSVMHLLKSGFIDADRNDVDLAENYIIKLGIRGRKAYGKKFSSKYKGVRPDEIEAAERVRVLLYEITRPVNDAVEKGITVESMTDAILLVCEELKMKEKLESRVEVFNKSDMPERAMEYSQIHDILMGQFENMKALIGDQKVSISEYSDLFEDALSEVRVGVIPPLADVVMAGDLTRSRFSDIKALFFVGMTEGAIPKASKRGGLISDRDREILKQAGVEVAPTAAENADTEKYYFYADMMKSSTKLIFSYPRTSLDGEICRESYFMKEARRVLKAESYNDGISYETVISEEEVVSGFTDSIYTDENKAALYLKGLRKLYDRDRYKLRNVNYILEKLKARYRSEEILGKDAADKIFGNNYLDSPTELEMFAACPYKHFLRYGLRLNERRSFEMDMRDIGTLLHKVLELYSRKIMESRLSFKSVSDDISDRILNDAIKDALDERALLLMDSSSRYTYANERLKKYAERSVETLRFQAKGGTFQNVYFEKRFNHAGLKGTIDRSDEAVSGNDIFIDVIDYKTGNRYFEPDKIYYGLDIQLPLYLKAAMELRTQTAEGRKIRPAGLFYYHIDDPVVEGTRESKKEDIEKEIHKELRLRGVVNSDRAVINAYDSELVTNGKSLIIPVGYKKDGSFDSFAQVYSEEEMNGLIDHTLKLTGDLRKRIIGGEVSKRPYMLGKATECEHCTYKTICDGGKKRFLKKKSFPEAWIAGDED